MSEQVVLPITAWHGAGPLDVVIDGGVLLDVAHRTGTAVAELVIEIGRLTDARNARIVVSTAQRNRAERVEQVLLDLWRGEQLVAQVDNVADRIVDIARRNPTVVVVAGLRVRTHLERAGIGSDVFLPRRRRGTWSLEEVTPAGTSAVLSQIADALNRRRTDLPSTVPMALWACVNDACDERLAHPAHLIRDPQVSTAGTAQCPSCAMPLIEAGDQRHSVGVWLTGPDGTRRLIRLAAGDPLVLGRTMGSGIYGLDRLGLTEDTASRLSRRHLQLQVTRRGRRGRVMLTAVDAGATNGTAVIIGSRRDCLGREPVELDDRVRLELPGGITIRRSGARAPVENDR